MTDHITTSTGSFPAFLGSPFPEAVNTATGALRVHEKVQASSRG